MGGAACEHDLDLEDGARCEDQAVVEDTAPLVLVLGEKVLADQDFA